MKFVIGLGKVIDLLCGRDSEVVRFPFTIEPHLLIMVSALTSDVVDHGFEPRSGQTKEYIIGICCFSANNA